MGGVFLILLSLLINSQVSFVSDGVDFLFSARESPVAWEGEPMEGVDNNQASQSAGPESHGSPGTTQGQRRWEAEEETKEDQPQPEDEESNSGVCDLGRLFYTEMFPQK